MAAAGARETFGADREAAAAKAGMDREPAAAAAAAKWSEPWMISKRPRNWAELQDSNQLSRRLRDAVFGDESSGWFSLCILYGRPGRGKTTMCKLICGEAAFAKEINGSSERRKDELRDALTEFTHHWHMAKAKAKAKAKASGSGTEGVPACVLFVDEADGLGPWGQGMLASFVSEMMERGVSGRLPPSSGRGRILFACNDVGKLHPSLLGKAALVCEVPRPSADDLMRCAISSGTSCSNERLVEVCRSADGDYRTLLQLLEIEDGGVNAGAGAGAGAGSGSAMTTTSIPRPVARILMLKDTDPEAVWAVLDETWKAGSRTDVLVDWVEQILPLVQDELLRARLLQLHSAWSTAQPETLLQVVGAYFRCMMGINNRDRVA